MAISQKLRATAEDGTTVEFDRSDVLSIENPASLQGIDSEHAYPVNAHER